VRVLHRQVDYIEGKAAPWYPKGESPILSDLVERGVLPPVAERTGPEPCVMQGVEGIGKYGGTWIKIASSPSDATTIASRMSGATLLRWSPQGFPIVAHVAKSYSVSEDNRTFTFELRKGMRWSDGHPFTTADISYVWNDVWLDDAPGPPRLPDWLRVKGRAARLTVPGPRRFRIVFPEPNGLFPALMATSFGQQLFAPSHYLRPYHPKFGDREPIRRHMRQRNLATPRDVYGDVAGVFNPERPGLWPWVYRSYRSQPPQEFVRNPYYWVVDPRGNQLPYIDRVLFEQKSGRMIGVAFSKGAVSMQRRHTRYEDYTLLMSERKSKGYEVYHWEPGMTSNYCIFPNLNLRVDPEDPESRLKHELFNDVRFRRALSLAIDRQAIIDAEWNGQTEPAQAAPGPASFFHDPAFYKSYTAFDPDEANRLLDEIGLTKRDGEGFRTHRDGSRMTFFLNYCGWTPTGPGQFLADDWARVGIRVVLRERSRSLYSTERRALKHDLTVWDVGGRFHPLLSPYSIVPTGRSALYAQGFGKWYERGGRFGSPEARPELGCIEPPADHPLRRAMTVYQRAAAAGDLRRQRDIFREALRIAADNVWSINIASPPPTLVIVKDGFRNVPKAAVGSWSFLTPANTGIETYYFEAPHDSPGAIEQMKRSLAAPDSLPGATAATSVGIEAPSGRRLGRILRFLFVGIAAALLLLVAFKRPYVGRRLLIMIPTLLIISIVAFAVIQLPPGSYVDTRIMMLEESGDRVSLDEIRNLRAMFHLDESPPVQYARWLGLPWLLSFDEKDKGLLQGHMGRAMETKRWSPRSSATGSC